MPTLRVGVLMLPGQVPLDLIGPLQVLHSAERIAGSLSIRYFGPSPSLDWLGPLTLSGIEPLPQTPQRLDLLLVPGQYRNAIETALQQICADWLRVHSTSAETIMSVCSGTLLLAQAGLLDGRRCTTHHALLETLSQIAPAARVQGDCIFTEDGRYLTSAGISTGIDTMLHWLMRRCGHALSLAVAREMVLYLRRSGHEPQLGCWLEGRNHVDARIHRLQDALSSRLKHAWSLPAMAAEAAMSERHLRRRFKALTGLSLSEYLTRLRLQLARQLMQETAWSLARIAEEVGLGEDRQLRRAWQRFESGSPREWRRIHRHVDET
ncbi:Transcriptional regulator GlxA family, contains an amidase domain and an AraC-type DNA-binding HTH domain [Modicisalibacter muralis]|uniref:Transcriptional regulator GlxA family, contains an amidase domain and an AraC-type DNA-binding HTH domain n=1 Tax=Modicisalibacter muralis TaxID=119000 RepID=A0A1G9RWP6_9GAMM|nr:helix-turn-helix domain-containing protein [Halomonas muralis]SDM27646.1 Transcriptional regulator GlxA family, contains an amidase domain and an AraC-type DNA-binding HTH domain [Halomonas muralis]